MELASMLGGEPFSDHPGSACPVIGSFLRAYNDSVVDERRQDLYAYAAKVVGSRSGAAVQRRRAERLAEWAIEMQRRRWTRVLPLSRLRTIRLHRHPSSHAIGTYAVRAIPRHSAETHREVLALIDELLAMGTPGSPHSRRRSGRSSAPRCTRRPEAALRPTTQPRTGLRARSAVCKAAAP